MLEIYAGIVTLICLVLLYAVYNLLRKVESLSAFVLFMQTEIQSVLDVVRMIDYKGYFKNDDEVGYLFTSLQAAIEELEVFIEDDIEEEDK